jgi:hypothetical protein
LKRSSFLAFVRSARTDFLFSWVCFLGRGETNELPAKFTKERDRRTRVKEPNMGPICNMCFSLHSCNNELEICILIHAK